LTLLLDPARDAHRGRASLAELDDVTEQLTSAGHHGL